MGSPPAHKVPAAGAVREDVQPKDYYASPAMARDCGFALYEHVGTGIVFAATERTDPGAEPVCQQPDCELLARAVMARLVKGTTREFLAAGLIQMRQGARALAIRQQLSS